MFKTVRLIVLFSLLALPYYAVANDCGPGMASVEAAPIKFPDHKVGMGLRRMFDTSIPNTQEAQKVATEMGALWWSNRIYFQSDLSTVLQHDNLERNVLKKGLYIIADPSIGDQIANSVRKATRFTKLAKAQKEKGLSNEKALARAEELKKPAVELYRKLIDSAKFYYVNADADGNQIGEPLEIPHSDIVKMFKAEKVDAAFDAERTENHLVVWGWTYPVYRGILLHERVDPKKSKTYSVIFQHGTSKVKQGWTLSFNKGVDQAFRLLENQDRTAKHLWKKETIIDKDGNKKDIPLRVQKDASTNRYTKPGVIEKDIQGIKDGDVIIVGMFTPELTITESEYAEKIKTDKIFSQLKVIKRENGSVTVEKRLVGGALYHKSGNIYAPDTVFYDTTYDSQAVNFAKDALAAFMDRMIQAGFEFTDTEMVTPLTGGMGAKYVLTEDYEKLKAKIPKENVKIDLTTDWTGFGR